MARATGKCIDGSQRIASLLPSATEILGDLGVPIEWMVGISHECDIFRDETSTQQLLQHSRILTYSSFDPNTMSQLEIDSLVKEDAQRIQKKCMLSEITGLNVVETKNISEIYSINTHELIESNPNLIFTQSLCGVCAVNSIDVQNTIRNTNIKNCNIVNLSPSSLQEVKESFEIVSEACGLSKECGQELVEKFHTDLKFVKDAVSAIEDKSDDKKRRPRVLLLEWLEPVFTGGHWIQEMIECAGCAPVLSESAKRSVERSWADVVETDPDCIIIACCGFDLKRNLDDARKFLFNDSTFGKQLRQMRATKNGKLFAVDGNRYFARPSPSLSAGVAIIARIAHDDQTEICRILEASDLLPLETKGWERVSSKSDANENKVYRLEDMEDLNVLTSWQRVHEEACKEHLDHYIDPATGYFVFTKYAHQKRGYCCGKGCRHCAYFHANVKMSERTKRIQRPSFLHQRCSHENNELPFKVLFFSGGKDSFIALREIASHQNTCSNIILLTTFDNHSRIIPEQDIHIDMVVKQVRLVLLLIYQKFWYFLCQEDKIISDDNLSIQHVQIILNLQFRQSTLVFH